MWLTYLIAIAAVLAFGYLFLIVRIVVYSYEAALLYDNGRYTRTLGPGVYYRLRRRTKVERLDLRRYVTFVPKQEILTADTISIRVTLVLDAEVADPVRAAHETQDHRVALHTTAQIALRDIVSRLGMDELLKQRGDLGRELTAIVSETAATFGVKVHSVAIRDLALPGDLKNIYAEVTRAQKAAQAKIERARGETATLRHLANAANLLQNNPALMNLRILQALDAGGNTVVLGAPGGVVPLRTSADGPAVKPTPPPAESDSKTE
jgi:regulator of protease activity HflC (stomatin/prohibitin superfamily)